jgi:NAD+ kinase
MKIAVLENHRTEFGNRITDAVLALLQASPCEVICRTEVQELSCGADVVIVLGGDGTILRVAKLLSESKTPVLGINLGRVGYLAELEPNELSLLSCLWEGNYRVEARMMLQVQHGTRILTALNDVVVSNHGASRLTEIGASHNGKNIGTYLADGVIVATPTGSTAYSMSAGGSVLEPTLHCLSLTPICPIGAYAKPLIFSSESRLDLHNSSREDASLCLTVDGSHQGDILPGETVQVSCAQSSAYFLHIKQDSFCNTLRNKVLFTGETRT